LILRPSLSYTFDPLIWGGVTSGVTSFFVSFASLTQSFNSSQFMRLRKTRVPHDHLKRLVSKTPC